MPVEPHTNVHGRMLNLRSTRTIGLSVAERVAEREEQERLPLYEVFRLQTRKGTWRMGPP
jgi:hypothetical protein